MSTMQQNMILASLRKLNVYVKQGAGQTVTQKIATRKITAPRKIATRKNGLGEVVTRNITTRNRHTKMYS